MTMHLSHHHLTRKDARRILWSLFAMLILGEVALALHALSVHDVIAGSLAFTALGRDSIVTLIEHFVADIETVA
jgi:hypothetical protein